MVHNFVFCTVIALVLWKFVPGIGRYGFLSSFVYSQCIGNSVCILAIFTTQTFQKIGTDNRLFQITAVTLISILGAVVGWVLANWFVSSYIDPNDNKFDLNSIAFSAFIAIVASVIFNTYIAHRQNVLKLQLIASEETRRADNARHAMLQAQLEPHMLFNTLANLRALIDTDRHKAIEMLDRLDNFLRETLSSSKTRSHSLEHEFSVLDDYLALMKVRFGDRLQYTLDLEENCKERLVPSLLLQPIVENAIRHGIEPQVSGGDIIVTAQCRSEQTVLSVVDSGGGFDISILDRSATLNENESSTSGFGLTTLKERLIHSYGEKARIDVVSSSSSGTTITLTIPLFDKEQSL